MKQHHTRTGTDDRDQCRLPGTITSVKAQAKRNDRVNVFVGEQFCFACRATVAADFGLHIGTEITASIREDVLREDDYQSAYQHAIELLAYRARSEREIRTRLRQRDCNDDVIDRVIARLNENNYLDDAEFARYWIENRTANRPRGDRALRQELFQKGIDSSLIDEALAGADLDQRALAIEAGRKRAGSFRGLPADTQRRRLAGFLQRRGFGWDAIGPALQELLGPDSASEDDPQ